MRNQSGKNIAYKVSIPIINCSGRLEKDRVYLDDIGPFAFAGIELYR